MSGDEPQPDPAPPPDVDEPPAYQPDHELIVPSVKEDAPTEPRWPGEGQAPDTS